MRGYFGIGIVGAKVPENLGTLWRSAQAMGAGFVFTVGKRWPGDRTDTTKATDHIPLYHYHDLVAFNGFARPAGARLVIVETKIGQYKPVALPQYQHPERAIYLLGSEDRGVPKEFIEETTGTLSDRADLVEIPTQFCLNVAVAGSIVMYDRAAKA